MRPIYQSGLTVLVCLCLLALFFASRWINMAGVFTSAAPLSANVCRTLASLPGPGDFQIDPPHNAILVASADARHPGPEDGIYVLKLDDPAAAPVKLAGAPKDFHPVSISLYRLPDGGSETLVAANRRAKGRPTIEIFGLSYDGATPKLISQSAIAGGLLADPDAVFTASPNQFYVTNAHAATGSLGRFAEDRLLWAHSDLLYFNGMNLQIAVQRLAHPSAVFVTPDGAHLYVAIANERRLIGFSRENFTGNLTEIGSLSLPAIPDKITGDSSGGLIVAGHPDLLKDRAFAADAGKPSPSEIFRVYVNGQGAPQGFETLYANDGHAIGAASVAAVMGKRLLIGSALDNKLVDCTLK